MERPWCHERSRNFLPPPFSLRAANATTICGAAIPGQSQEYPAPSGNPHNNPTPREVLWILWMFAGRETIISVSDVTKYVPCGCRSQPERRCRNQMPDPHSRDTAAFVDTEVKKHSGERICINANIETFLEALASRINHSTTDADIMDFRKGHKRWRTHISLVIQNHIPLHGMIG